MKAYLLISVTFILGACRAKPVPLLQSIGSNTLPPTTEATSLPCPEEAAGIALKATTDGILSGLIHPDHWEDPTYGDTFDGISDHITPSRTGGPTVSKRTLPNPLPTDDCKRCMFHYGTNNFPPNDFHHGLQRSQDSCPSYCRSDEKSKQHEEMQAYIMKHWYGRRSQWGYAPGIKDPVTEPFYDDILRFADKDYSHMSEREFREEMLRIEKEEQEQERHKIKEEGPRSRHGRLRIPYRHRHGFPHHIDRVQSYRGFHHTKGHTAAKFGRST